MIVGAGPAGLATACHLAALADEHGLEIAIAVVEKGAEVGSHIVSGAIVDTRALAELFPDFEQRGAPLGPVVASESVCWLASAKRSISVPRWLVPRSLHNRGHRIVSLGRLCRWLGEQAEAASVDILTGFAATEMLFDDKGRVTGVATGATGIAADGSPKPGSDPGYELKARYVVLAEGCRGNLAQIVEQRFDLRRGRDPQHYGIGFKEDWRVLPQRHRPGHVLHSFGWPLDHRTEGGGFAYHAADGHVSIGFVVALNYRNPWLDPFAEFQRFKQHPAIRPLLEGGQRLGFGARAVNKGGLNSLPRPSFPGGLLVGCDAGFLNGARLKGTHAAIKSGMLAAGTIARALAAGDVGGSDLVAFDAAFRASWLHGELAAARNFSAGIARFGSLGGGLLALVEHNLLRGRPLFTLHQPGHDRDALRPVAGVGRIDYPKPDGKVSFDRLSSVHLANLEHAEDQPCHLQLTDPAVPLAENLPRFGEPAERYCPAGVYEIVTAADGAQRLQINAANCVHCKTCEIKDPAGNIRWQPPEGGSGPKYADL